jgi:hypothetical protein
VLRAATLDDSWEGLTSPELLGGFGPSYGGDVPSGGLAPGVVASTPPSNPAPLYSPENPLFWLGVVIVLGTGLIAVSTHWRIGTVAHGSESV